MSGRYPASARLLHWAMAALLLSMLFLGAAMVDRWQPWATSAIQLHKAFGLLALALAVLRLVNRLRFRAPPLPAGMPAAQRAIAHASHVLLYALMLALPLTGWAMQGAAGLPVQVAGWGMASVLVLGLAMLALSGGAVWPDARAMALLGCAMGAGFLAHPSYKSLLPAVAVGPACAVTAFVVNRKLQMRRVRMRGEGKVGDLYFVDEVDLLTRTEVETRMDRLLAKIAATGMDSLTIEERRFLKHASQRLKRSPSEETRA